MWISDLPMRRNPNKIWIDDPVLTEADKVTLKKVAQDMADEIDKKIVEDFIKMSNPA